MKKPPDPNRLRLSSPIHPRSTSHTSPFTFVPVLLPAAVKSVSYISSVSLPCLRVRAGKLIRPRFQVDYPSPTNGFGRSGDHNVSLAVVQLENQILFGDVPVMIASARGHTTPPWPETMNVASSLNGGKVCHASPIPHQSGPGKCSCASQIFFPCCPRSGLGQTQLILANCFIMLDVSFFVQIIVLLGLSCFWLCVLSWYGWSAIFDLYLYWVLCALSLTPSPFSAPSLQMTIMPLSPSSPPVEHVSGPNALDHPPLSPPPDAVTGDASFPPASQPSTDPQPQTVPPSYADSVRFGFEGSHPSHPSALHGPSHVAMPPLQPGEDASLPPPRPSLLGDMDELIALCLLAKIWGEILPIALIIAKTKLDWKHVKGLVMISSWSLRI